MSRVSVYIDNSNVFKLIQSIRQGGDRSWVQLYDPLKLANILAGNRELGAVYFYCVPPPPWLLTEGEAGKERHATAQRYYDAIGKLPHVEVKYGYLQGDKNDPREKNVDTQIATDMVAHAALSKYDIAILVTNDGDYMSALQNVKLLGKKVELLFFKGHLAGSLRPHADLLRRARRSYFQHIFKPTSQQPPLIPPRGN